MDVVFFLAAQLLVVAAMPMIRAPPGVIEPPPLLRARAVSAASESSVIKNVLGEVNAWGISSSTENWTGGAKGWLGRFPKLEAAVNDTTHEQRCVQIWKGLGENHWMEFVDGRAHAGGPHVFDNSTSEHPGRRTGNKTFENQHLTYNEFCTEDAWKSRWSVGKLAELNARFSKRDCEESSCADMFDSYGTLSNLSASEKKAALVHILAEYHDAIDAIRAPMSERNGGTHIQQALPHIAVLFQNLALLHPFHDGNSRTRTMVLQTELVRQGGHPAVLWDNYWGIYSCCGRTSESLAPPAQLQEYVLDGWCGWEIAYNSNGSPFLPFVRTEGTLLSTPHAQYNTVTGACEEGPRRSYMVPAFDKNHPDRGIRTST